MSGFLYLIIIAIASYGIMFGTLEHEKLKQQEKEIFYINRLKKGLKIIETIQFKNNKESDIVEFYKTIKETCKEQEIRLQYYDQNDWAFFPFYNKTMSDDDLSRTYFLISRKDIEKAKKDIKNIENIIINKYLK